MMNIRIDLAYDGLYFKGSQKQKESRTIQGELEKELSNLFLEKIKVSICSRLDALVSASNFTVSFKTENKSNIPLINIKKYLEDKLFPFIYIKKVSKVSDDFHPRAMCKNKTYSYLIQNGYVSDLLLLSHSYVSNIKLDINKIKEVLDLYKGIHDFSLFCTNDDNKNTILKIDDTKLIKKGNLLFLKFTSKAFLKYQVRFLVGTILLYCENKIELEDIKEALKGNKTKKYFKRKAEPQALMLEELTF